MLGVRISSPMDVLLSFVRYKADRLRLAKLMRRGLKIGKNVYIAPRVEIDSNYPFLISIGDDCRISLGVRILAHDATTFRDLGITRIAPVKILEASFIGQRSFILPGVTIGPRALIGAGSVVNRNIGEDAVAAGNPARPYGKFSELLEKYRDLASSAVIFDKAAIQEGSVTQEDLIRAVQETGVSFVRGAPDSDPYYVHADWAAIRSAANDAFAVAFASRACSSDRQ